MKTINLQNQSINRGCAFMAPLNKQLNNCATFDSSTIGLATYVLETVVFPSRKGNEKR